MKPNRFWLKLTPLSLHRPDSAEHVTNRRGQYRVELRTVRGGG